MGNSNKTTSLLFYKKCENFIKSVLKKHLPTNSKVLLFGSRVKGDYNRSSDVDIGVISDNLNRKIIIKIKEDIEESFVPFDVDIIDFNKVDKAFKKEALKNHKEWKIN